MGYRNIIASLLGIAMLGLAQPAAAEGYFYVEGSAGISFIEDVDGTFSFPGSSQGSRSHHVGKGHGSLVGIPVSLSINDGANFGVEVGAANYADTGLRIGVAFWFVNFEIESATALGITIPASALRTSNELVEVVEGRLYYDIPLEGIVTPYVGVGLGAADYTGDAAFIYSLIGGAQVDITDNVYLGARYTYSNTDIDGGPGVTVDAIDVHSISGQIGIRFGNTR